MATVTTGDTTVPKALKLLGLAHDEIDDVERDVRALDGMLLVGGPDEFGNRLRTVGGQTWGTVARLANSHLAILKAAGELSQSDIDTVGQYTRPEPHDDGRYHFDDFLGDASGGIMDFDYALFSFAGALGTWAALGGDFSKHYRDRQTGLREDTKVIKPWLKGGTELVLGFVLAPIGAAAVIAELPGDVKGRYEAASVRLESDEARRTSAGMATAVAEAKGESVKKIVGKGKVGYLLGKLADAAPEEQEAFARGIGDMYGAMVDYDLGHTSSIDAVMQAARDGVYGRVLAETINIPDSLLGVVGASFPEYGPLVIHGTPIDRDRPAISGSPDAPVGR